MADDLGEGWPSAEGVQAEDALRTEAIASEALNALGEISGAAASRLNERPSPTPHVLASYNSITSDKALRTLTTISDEERRSAELICRQPIIARLEVEDEDGKQKTLYITPGTPPKPTVGQAQVASYRSPIGRLAAMMIGGEVEIQTPSGRRSYDLMHRTRLKPVQTQNTWDSENSVLESVGSPPLTIVSLRALLARAAEDVHGDFDFIGSQLADDAHSRNVKKGLRRAVLDRMGLREQPLLDQFQDDIFRLPLQTAIAIMGPPGTGKTTTLIKRLGMKLDLKALEEAEHHELRHIDKTVAGRSDHSRSWLMFTPTELLRLYVKEAFAREQVAASDREIRTWAKFSVDIARNHLRILKSATSPGATPRASLNHISSEAIRDQRAWYTDFNEWQIATFWSDLRSQAETLTKSEDSTTAELGRRIGVIVGKAERELSSEPFVTLRALIPKIEDALRRADELVEKITRDALTRHVNRSPERFTALVRFVTELDEVDGAESEDIDPDLDDDDEETEAADLGDRERAFDAYKKAVRAKARAVASGRKLNPKTRAARIFDWLGPGGLGDEQLAYLARDVAAAAALRRVRNPIRTYLTGVQLRYRQFRRARQAEGRWYTDERIVPREVAAPEVDLIILATLRGARVLLADVALTRAIDDPSMRSLHAIRELFRNQILVDEATDFSPLQLASMSALCAPELDAFVISGDFNQRITSWGVRTQAELRWAVPDIDVREIRVTYRHSPELNAFAHQVALISDPSHVQALLPAHMDSKGVQPALIKSAAGADLVAWLRDRILEIEKLTKKLPSTAILVSCEDEVAPLAQALNEALAPHALSCEACREGKVVGQDNDVRVFDVQHIKGLEFEAVFFVSVDKLAALNPDLFDKYIYVGATRAATYLGVTSESDRLPRGLAELEDAFCSQWDNEQGVPT